MPNVWDEIFQQIRANFPEAPRVQPQEIDTGGRQIYGTPDGGPWQVYIGDNDQLYSRFSHTGKEPFVKMAPGSLTADTYRKYIKAGLLKPVKLTVSPDSSGLATPQHRVKPSETRYMVRNPGAGQPDFYTIENGKVYMTYNGKKGNSALKPIDIQDLVSQGKLKADELYANTETPLGKISRSQDIRRQTQRYTGLARGLQEATKGVDPKSPMFRKLLDQVLKNQGFGDPSLVMNLIPRSLIQQVQEQVQKLTQPPQG